MLDIKGSKLSTTYNFLITIIETLKEDSVNEGSSSDAKETVEEVLIEEIEKELASSAEIESIQDELSVSVVGLPPSTVVPPMTNEQATLSQTPAAEIPPAKLFTPVPLEARMSLGV